MFAVALTAGSFVWLWGFVNLLSAALAAAAALFYVFVYSLWLKRTSIRNIVIGGAAGAVADPRGLDRGHGFARLASGGALRRDLLLDSAALLGSRDPLPQRLQGR